MNRRDFIAGCGAFAASAALGRPVRSAIGIQSTSAETQFLPTASDYIQDGLVGLWDAIENVEYGVHDDVSTVWTNLVDGTYTGITGALNTNYCWTDKAFKRFTISLGSATCDITDSLLEAVRDASFSYEVVSSNPNQSANWYAQLVNIQDSLSQMYNKGISLIIRREEDGLVCMANGASYFTPGMEFYLSSCEDLSTSTAVFDNGYCSLYSDSDLCKSKAVQTSDTFSGCFVRIGGANYGFRGDFHCVRIYNRPITQQEINHNRMIDKARFGR